MLSGGFAMDVTLLANNLVAALAPFLPFLLRLGQDAAEGAGRSLGTEAWEHAKALWERLGGRLQERPGALAAAQDAAEAPDDDDARAAFRLQLRKLLADDARLASELRRLLDEGPAGAGSSTIVTASGERAIAVGRDATGSTFVTGDRRAEDPPEPG
jgi:hypothetical protein